MDKLSPHPVEATKSVAMQPTAMLVVLVNRGLPLHWAVHMGTAAGTLMLTYAIWRTGGIFSPRCAWLLILPLTPFYTVSRRAGLFWLLAILIL